MRRSLLTVFMLACTLMSWTQIFEPEGLNIPGDWNSWTNPPAANSAFGSYTQVSGGRVTKISTGTARWQTIFHVAASGADAVGGTPGFKFTSGSSGSPWSNEWGSVSVTLNTLQTYTLGGGNNSVTITNDKWYTVNWRDAGYTNTSAIFMETSAEPVLISSVSQLPLSGSVESTDDVVVTVTTNNAPSAEEKIYVRYAINGNWAGSTNVLVSFTGNVGTANIPMQTAATNVAYYVFSTTITSPSPTDADMLTIRLNNNGGTNYNYTVNTPLPPVDVTFQVDMSQQTVDMSGVFISGSFNGFAQQAMVDEGGGIWSYTTALNQGVPIEYKFRNGTSYEGNLSAPCGNGSNRTHTVGDEDEVLALVCFSSCDACPPPPVTVNVTFRVNMSQQTVTGNGVHVAGSFQGTWNPATIALTDGNDDEIYEVTYAIEENTEIQFKYINGNSWGNDESVAGPCASFGNRVVQVGDEDMTLDIVCFASCDNCPEGIPTQPVTFRLNMGTNVPSADGVHLAGNFGNAGYPNWVETGIEMTDDDGDFIYEVTLNLNENSYYDYKFINGNIWDDAETSGGLAGCEFLGNRTLYVATSSLVLPRVCFNSCSNCTFATPNDIPAANSPNMNAVAYVYPNCLSVQGTTVGATVSAYTGGRDVWYKFVSISNGVSIRVASSAIDAKIYLFRGSAPSTPAAEEDALVGITGTEILNFGGLVEGEQYYIAVVPMDANDGTFSICVQQLRKPKCTTAGPYSLCTTFKSSVTGATNTTFSFTDADTEALTSVTSSNPIVLGNAALQLQYEHSYDVTITANYNLLNGAGGSELIQVPNQACAITLIEQPKLEVKSNQRCANGASLFRSSFLQASPVSSGLCGITGYRVEFTPVNDCAGVGAQTLESFSKTISTTSASISLNYAFNQIPLSGNSGIGYWSVRWLPRFGSVEGEYGEPHVIAVNGTAPAGMLLEPSEELNGLTNSGTSIEANIYPNPNNGDMVNLNMTGITTSDVFVRIMDNMGRVVYTNRYSADGSLNIVVSFSKPLAAGLYMVEFTSGKEVITHRMMVSK